MTLCFAIASFRAYQMAMRGTASGVSRAKAEFDARAAGNAACDAKFLTSKILRNLLE